MIITPNTNNFFKLQAGDMVIALQPTAGAGKKKASKFGSNIALQSVYSPEGLEYASYGDNVPVAIYGPGSYEVEGIAIEGFGMAPEQRDNESAQDFGAVYTFMFDDMRIGVLGDCFDKKLLPSEALEALAETDIIFVSPQQEAVELATTFSPHLIIAGEGTDTKEAKEFIDTLTSEQHEVVDKLTIKRKDITEKQSFVYVFSA